MDTFLWTLRNWNCHFQLGRFADSLTHKNRDEDKWHCLINRLVTRTASTWLRNYELTLLIKRQERRHGYSMGKLVMVVEVILNQACMLTKNQQRPFSLSSVTDGQTKRRTSADAEAEERVLMAVQLPGESFRTRQLAWNIRPEIAIAASGQLVGKKAMV